MSKINNIKVADLIEETKNTPEYLVDPKIFHILAEEQTPVITKKDLLNLITKNDNI